jgi:hypothetical protein
MVVFLHAARGNDEQARRAVADLESFIDRQKGDFRLVWEWTILRSALTISKEAAVVARRETLSGLLDALEPGRDKAAVLADLNRLSKAFPGPNEKATK